MRLDPSAPNQTPAAKAAWQQPVVRRLDAGKAENGAGFGGDGGFVIS